MKQVLNLVSESLHSTSTVTYHLSIALLMVSHHKLGLTMINQKEYLNVSTVSSNSYKLNAQLKYNIKQSFKLKYKGIG
jgi:hypothetical protein